MEHLFNTPEPNMDLPTLSHDGLARLREETAEFLAELREDPDPEDEGLMEAMEATYVALVELQAWRATFPDLAFVLSGDAPTAPTHASSPTLQ